MAALERGQQRCQPLRAHPAHCRAKRFPIAPIISPRFVLNKTMAFCWGVRVAAESGRAKTLPHTARVGFQRSVVIASRFACFRVTSDLN